MSVRLVAQRLQVGHVLHVLVDEAVALMLLVRETAMCGHVLDDNFGDGQSAHVQVAEFGAASAQRVYERVHDVGRVLDAEARALTHLRVAIHDHHGREHVANVLGDDERLERPFVDQNLHM